MKVAFGDVVEQIKDHVQDISSCGLTEYVRGEHFGPGNLRLTGRSTIGDGKHGSAFHMRFRQGDVLYVSRNPQLRKAAVADFEGICANTTYVCRAKEEYLLQELLPFIMQTESFVEYTIRHKRGSTNFYLNWSDIAGYEFALPPLEEQRRIAEVLQAAEMAKRTISAASMAADTAYQSVCKEHFLRSRTQIAHTPIGEVADVRNGTTPRRNRDDYWGGDVPWLPTGKVNERRISEADEWITQKALSECSLSIISAGSTLIAMIGQGATRGRAAFLQIDSAVNQNFAAVIPGDGVLASFLFYQLDALYGALRSWSQGSNQLALNCQLVSEFPIWVPSKAQQREISDVLDRVDQARAVLATRARAANAVQDRLLASCLEGL